MKPEFAILSQQETDGLIIFTVDTSKASYQGISWRTLGDFGKRKWENLLVLNDAKKRCKIIYV